MLIKAECACVGIHTCVHAHTYIHPVKENGLVIFYVKNIKFKSWLPKTDYYESGIFKISKVLSHFKNIVNSSITNLQKKLNN